MYRAHQGRAELQLHTVCDGQGRPIVMLLTQGQMSDHKGAVLLLSRLPQAKELLADKGYDSDWFRHALATRGITPCIPPTANRKVQHALRQTTLSPASQDREPVCPPQGLATHRHPLRPLRPHLHVRHHHRSYLLLLALINES